MQTAVMEMKKPPAENQGRCRGANNNIGQRGAMREKVIPNGAQECAPYKAIRITTDS
ncbi:hypothetical protein GCM10027181_31580 [Rheinheimera gaetbuli]